jgi:hypothetical protein
MGELMYILADVNRLYQGEDEDLITEVSAALSFRGQDIIRNHVDYGSEVASWLPTVPYGLASFGLIPIFYKHSEGHLLKAWSFPDSPISEKYGPILLAYDYLENSAGEEFTGFRFFFQESAIGEKVEPLVEESGEIIFSPSDENYDIAFYKCIIADGVENSIRDTLDIARNSLFQEGTLEILENATDNKVPLEILPNGESISNVL